jgi:hypothetical protein
MASPSGQKSFIPGGPKRYPPSKSSSPDKPQAASMAVKGSRLDPPSADKSAKTKPAPLKDPAKDKVPSPPVSFIIKIKFDKSFYAYSHHRNPLTL